EIPRVLRAARTAPGSSRLCNRPAVKPTAGSNLGKPPCRDPRSGNGLSSSAFRTGGRIRRFGLRARTGGRQEGMLHRGYESTDGTGGGELSVPMAWLYAEYIADELLRTGDLMPPTSFEFRAGRDALALTVFLSDTDGELSGIRVVSQLENWASLTAYDQPWQE